MNYVYYTSCDKATYAEVSALCSRFSDQEFDTYTIAKCYNKRRRPICKMIYNVDGKEDAYFLRCDYKPYLSN